MLVKQDSNSLAFEKINKYFTSLGNSSKLAMKGTASNAIVLCFRTQLVLLTSPQRMQPHSFTNCCTRGQPNLPRCSYNRRCKFTVQTHMSSLLVINFFVFVFHFSSPHISIHLFSEVVRKLVCLFLQQRDIGLFFFN